MDAHELDAFDRPSRRRAEIKDRDAVLAEVHAIEELGLQVEKLHRREITDEYRVLKRFAEILRDAMDTPQPPRLADVIGEQVPRAARHRYRVVKGR